MRSTYLSGPILGRWLPALALLAMMSGCGGCAGCAKPKVSLSLITITPSEGRLPRGGTLACSAIGLYSDGSTQVLTDKVNWSVDDAWVASLDSAQPGLLNGLNVGRTTVRAELTGVTSSRDFTVYTPTVSHLEFDPPSPTIPMGLAVQVRVLAVQTDDTVRDVTAEVLWSTTEGSGAVSLNEVPGQVKAVRSGSATLLVSMEGVSATAHVTVTSATIQALTLSPWGPTTPVGVHLALHATATLSDGSMLDLTTSSQWTSSAPEIAFVSSLSPDQGQVFARSAGTATIRAEVAGIAATTPFTVSVAGLSRVEIAPSAPSLAAGTSAPLSASGVYTDGRVVDLTGQAAWSVDDTTVATVSPAGVLTGVTKGSATVSALFDGVIGKATVAVTDIQLVGLTLTPAQATLAKGTSRQFSVTGRFTDGSTQDVSAQAIWSSSDDTLAPVSNAPGTQGLVRGLDVGTVTLTARLLGQTSTAQLTVTRGELTQLQLSPTNPKLYVGASAQLTVTGVFSDGTNQDLTNQVAYASSSPQVASVTSSGNARGLVRAHADGVATITAGLGTISGTAEVVVSPATIVSLTLSPSPLTLALGTTAQLTATGAFTDGTSRDVSADVTWWSEDPTVATVSNAAASKGAVASLKPGSTRLAATLLGLTSTVAVTVTPARLDTLEVSPVEPFLAAGTWLQLTAIGHYSDGSTQTVTGQATWSTANTSVATVSGATGSAGKLSALTPGSTTVTAQLGAVVATTLATVTSARLVSIAVSPASPSLPLGTTLLLSATGTWTDGTVRDISSQVTWTSADLTVASVSNASGLAGEVRAVSVKSTDITATLGTVSASTTVTVTPAVLSRLELIPALPIAPIGSAVVFTATSVWSDGSTTDATAQATWTSSDPAVASVTTGTAGRVSALTQGTTTITAQLGGKTATATLTVTPAALARIDVTPATATIARLTTARFHATGIWTDGTTQDLTAQVTWSADVAGATVSNVAPRQGLATGLTAGTATVSAQKGTVTGTATLVVTAATLTRIDVTPPSPSAPAGLTLPLFATGAFSDGTTQDLTGFVSWSSSDGALATVATAFGSEGLVSAVAVGTPTLSATALGQTGSVTFVVTNALLVSLGVTPALASVPQGLTQPFAASGTFSDGKVADVTGQVTWSSSDLSKASVSNASGSRGVARGILEGPVTITALLSGKTATAQLTVTAATLSSVAVTPAQTTLAKGLTAQLSVTGVYSDGSPRDLTGLADWTSSDGAKVSVSSLAGSKGVVRGMAVGSATITASVGGLSAQATVTVTPAELVSIGLDPANPTVPLGLDQGLTANGIYTDGTVTNLTTQVQWSSSDPVTAPVSNTLGTKGVVHAAKVGGGVVVTATLNLLSGTTTVTVSPAALQQLQVTSLNSTTIAAGLKTQLVATGVYSDTSTQTLTGQVTWSSSAGTTVAVSNTVKGEVTGLVVGSATVSASLSGVTGGILVTVTPALLTQVQVTPANVSKPKGLTQQFTATGVYTDGNTSDLTNQVLWESSDVTRVSVSNAAGSFGLASTPGLGAVTIKATRTGISGTTPFTVTAATLVSVAVSPAVTQAPLGSVRQFTLTGTYTDASTQNLTAQASWVSTDPTVLSISNATGSRGLATTFTNGSVTITATYSGSSASATVVVSQTTLASIDLVPAAGSTALGYTRQFIAVGNYNDGTTQVLTNQVTWTTGDPADTGAAFISNAAGSHGVLSTVALGTVTVTASYLGVTASTTHTVAPAVLNSLAVSPGSATLAPAGTRQLTVLGYFSDGSTQDLTGAATWTSGTTAVAQVSNVAGSKGLVTGIATGSALITATKGSVTGSVTVTVQ